MKSHQRRLQAWQDAAVSYGLQIMKVQDDPSQPRLEALAGRLWVRIEISDDGTQFMRIAVVVPGPPDFIVVRIRPESTVPAEGEIEIGDESFDSTFVIKGPAPMAFALLDVETRRLLLRLSTDVRLEIRVGELRVEDESDKYLLALLPRLLEIGQRLAQAPDIPRRLAENATHDPEARVRFQSLLLLIREYPREPATLEVLRTSGATTAVDALAKLMKQNGELAIAAAQALGETGSPAAEPPLLLALQGEPEDLRMAAVKALGRVGTASAVLPLQEASRRSLFDFDFRRAAREAVAEIQARLKEAAAGQLSLAEAEAGQLSLSQAEAGQLSIAIDQAGQLSISGSEDEPENT
jgi:hypothetical protein